MEAKAIVCRHKGAEIKLENIVLPEIDENQVLIKTEYSGVSIGTEMAIATEKLKRGIFPAILGYQASGTIIEAGSHITNFKTGDKVYFRKGSDCNLENGEALHSFHGTHASHAVVNTNMVWHLPKNINMQAASMFVMPAVGMHGVTKAAPKTGDTVVAYGCGLIGLGVVAACTLRGCTVIAVDINDRQLAIAKELGAKYCLNSSDPAFDEQIRILIPKGAEAVFENSGIPALINISMKFCKNEGKFIWQGNYGDSLLPFDFMTAHTKQLDMYFPSGYGAVPCANAVLKNMSLGALAWEKCITHKVSYPEAAHIYNDILAGSKDYLGIVIDWA